MQKSKLAGLWGGLLVGLSSVLVAQAQTDPHGLGATARKAGYGQTSSDLYSMVGTIVTAFLGLLAFVFFGFMVYAGLRWMTARGNEEFITRAKDTMRNSIIGLVIIIASYALARFLLSRIGG